MLELAYYLIAAGICLWSTGTIWLAFFSPRRQQAVAENERFPPEWMDCQPCNQSIAERIARTPDFAMAVETRAIAQEGGDRSGILDITPQKRRELCR